MIYSVNKSTWYNNADAFPINKKTESLKAFSNYLTGVPDKI